MNSPRQTSHFADAAVHCEVPIERNDVIGRDTYRVRFRCPEIADRVVPGQFLMVRFPEGNDPLIGRPLAVYDVHPEGSDAPGAIDLVYAVLGKFTSRLAHTPLDQNLDVWGPLGNGFPPLECARLLMVAGGVGQTPFLTLAKEHLGKQRFGQPSRHPAPVSQIVLCFGAKSKDRLAGVDDFAQLGIDVKLATEDGTAGYRGVVTDVFERELTSGSLDTQVVCCGPVAMMRSVAAISARHQTRCLVSLETPMACGIGICFTCVAKIRTSDGAWDYQRSCVDGPVFDAASVEW